MIMNPLQNCTLGVLGGGNMAEALLKGVLSSGLMKAEDITVYDILPERRAHFENMGCTGAATPEQVLSAKVILVAVKPQNIREALAAIDASTKSLFVSIAAGVSTHALESLLGEDARVIRVMPNTPLLVGKGMAGLCRGSKASEDDMRIATALFRCGGDAVEVTEEAMDAVTALSGSGPAYVFCFAEAMFAAGEQMGLSPELSRRLTIGTIRGAAEMLEKDSDAAELRRKVTSPGGTTAAALDVFEKDGFAEMVTKALGAACDRSLELGRGQ